MKKKLPASIFVAVFLLICVVPSVGFFLFGPAKAGANERLAPKPSLFEKDGGLNGDFLSELSEYFSGRFFLRQEMISGNNAITAALLGSSAEDDVILGRDGWLYYADTLADYTGAAPMSEHALWAAAKNLSLMQEHCEAAGADFLFTIAPNKNSLYHENMPNMGAVADTRDADRLYTLCDELNIDYLDLFDAFEAREETLYFAHDSHWNSRGAALAADAILHELGRESDYFAGDFSASQPHTGDLFEMLYPAGADSETDPVYSPAIVLDYKGASVRPDSININAFGSGEGSLLAYRDSFGNNLYPYLADSFAEARFSRATAYDLTEPADCVLIELVERNIPYLTYNIPVMPAPERDVPAGEVKKVELELGSGNKPEGCALAFGTLDEMARVVYIICGDSAYEAFLLTDGSFAAYIPAGVEPDGVYYEIF